MSDTKETLKRRRNMASCPYCGMSDKEELGVICHDIQVGRRGFIRLWNGACSCGARGPDADGQEDAVLKWNTRAQNSTKTQKDGVLSFGADGAAPAKRGWHKCEKCGEPIDPKEEIVWEEGPKRTWVCKQCWEEENGNEGDE